MVGPEQGPTQDPPAWGFQPLRLPLRDTDSRLSQGMPERQQESGQGSVRVPAPHAGAE